MPNKSPNPVEQQKNKRENRSTVADPIAIGFVPEKQLFPRPSCHMPRSQVRRIGFAR